MLPSRRLLACLATLSLAGQTPPEVLRPVAERLKAEAFRTRTASTSWGSAAAWARRKADLAQSDLRFP